MILISSIGEAHSAPAALRNSRHTRVFSLLPVVWSQIPFSRCFHVSLPHLPKVFFPKCPFLREPFNDQPFNDQPNQPIRTFYEPSFLSMIFFCPRFSSPFSSLIWSYSRHCIYFADCLPHART